MKNQTHAVVVALKVPSPNAPHPPPSQPQHKPSSPSLLSCCPSVPSLRCHGYCELAPFHACVVLGWGQRAPSELSSYQPKVFALDKHVCMGISGLSSDARSLG